MLSHTGTLWQYLGSFILYTLLAIGLIYAVFCFTRSRAGSFLGLGTPVIKGRRAKLQIESILGLEPRKNLYVVRAGHERFLLATSIEETKLISRLDSLPEPAPRAKPESDTDSETVFEIPWHTEVQDTERPALLPYIKQRSNRNQGLGSRFVQSVQWLMASRIK